METIESSSIRRICYYSNFDVSIDDWITEYERLQSFRARVKETLGDLWLSYFTESINSANLKMEKNSALPLDNPKCDYVDALLECFQLDFPEPT